LAKRRNFTASRPEPSFGKQEKRRAEIARLFFAEKLMAES